MKESSIDQYEYVSDEILDLITNQDVSPDDILVIDLDSINLNDDFNMFKKTLYEKAWNEEDKVWKCKTNLVNKDNAVKFRIKDSIPFTTIFRAKGNEANIVFVVNSHKMRSISSYARNRIFTAMTRARFKVYVLGTKGMDGFIKEAETVKKNNYTLSFCYPTKAQLKKMSTIAQTEIKNAKDYEVISDLFKNIKSNPALIKEILLEQMGVSSIGKLFEVMQEDVETDE